MHKRLKFLHQSRFKKPQSAKKSQWHLPSRLGAELHQMAARSAQHPLWLFAGTVYFGKSFFNGEIVIRE